MRLRSIDELEWKLSEPTEGVRAALAALEGDVVVLGAGGKMGPTLAVMIRRAFDEISQPHRTVWAVSRFSNPAAAKWLEEKRVRVVSCDLLDRAAVQKLPHAENVIFMAGQKFGTSEAPEATWVMNTVVPAFAAERYSQSRTVVFSTGCVYPLAPIQGRGAVESDPLAPPGDYANSCVGRERVFGYFAKKNATPTLFYRLSYAIDLRYGVLRDVADKVFRGEPVDVTMGYANVIWQGDANARAIQSLLHATSPPTAINVTGLEKVAIRDLASRFAAIFGKPARLVGAEANTAWIFDASRSYEWFGPPTVSLDDMITATADWVANGGMSLGKPTHFEVRDGDF